VVRGLMSAAARDASEPVRRRAVDGLGRLGPGTPGLTEVFVRAMGDPSPKVRVRALYAVYGRVVRGGGREAAAGASLVAVEAAARDQNEGVREAAVFALGKLAETIDRAVVAMGAVLRDGTPEMRRVAARNLCALGPRAAPAWVELMMGLEDEDSQVQEAVVEALRGLGRS
jgi:HEAT repeat protein